MGRPTCVDLFAGAGGLSLGFEQAGFDVVAAVEVDPVHAAVHKYNFPQCTVLPKSVVGLTGREIRRAAKLGNRRIDVVVGGAPCQGFSLIGQRALDDPRNSLVREFVRIVAELNASYFVFENVKGLTVGKQRGFLEEIIAAFNAVGYNIRTPWRVLNASEYGVPQDRQRLILFGAKKTIRLPDYPSPITSRTGNNVALPPTPSCRQAIGDLPDAELFSELNSKDHVSGVKLGRPSAYAISMRCARAGDWHWGYRRDWDPSLLTSSARTDHTPISRRRFRETEQGEVELISRFFKLSGDGVCNTLRAGTDASRGAFTSPRPIHYDKPRCITVREMARLHGFPDWFRLHATKWHGARQIGNAVPPPLAREVGMQVMRALGCKPTRPRSALALGDAKLLILDLSQASEYWDVANPISRRDKKSGAKKRKQRDIEAAMFAGL